MMRLSLSFLDRLSPFSPIVKFYVSCQILIVEASSLSSTSDINAFQNVHDVASDFPSESLSFDSVDGSLIDGTVQDPEFTSIFGDLVDLSQELPIALDSSKLDADNTFVFKESKDAVPRVEDTSLSPPVCEREGSFLDDLDIDVSQITAKEYSDSKVLPKAISATSPVTTPPSLPRSRGKLKRKRTELSTKKCVRIAETHTSNENDKIKRPLRVLPKDQAVRGEYCRRITAKFTPQKVCFCKPSKKHSFFAGKTNCDNGYCVCRDPTVKAFNMNHRRLGKPSEPAVGFRKYLGRSGGEAMGLREQFRLVFAELVKTERIVKSVLQKRGMETVDRECGREIVSILTEEDSVEELMKKVGLRKVVEFLKKPLLKVLEDIFSDANQKTRIISIASEIEAELDGTKAKYQKLTTLLEDACKMRLENDASKLVYNNTHQCHNLCGKGKKAQFLKRPPAMQHFFEKLAVDRSELISDGGLGFIKVEGSGSVENATCGCETENVTKFDKNSENDNERDLQFDIISKEEPREKAIRLDRRERHRIFTPISRARDFLLGEKFGKIHVCNCKKGKCATQYCICRKQGGLCTDRCGCCKSSEEGGLCCMNRPESVEKIAEKIGAVRAAFGSESGFIVPPDVLWRYFFDEPRRRHMPRENDLVKAPRFISATQFKERFVDGKTVDEYTASGRTQSVDDEPTAQNDQGDENLSGVKSSTLEESANDSFGSYTVQAKDPIIHEVLHDSFQNSSDEENPLESLIFTDCELSSRSKSLTSNSRFSAPSSQLCELDERPSSRVGHSSKSTAFHRQLGSLIEDVEAKMGYVGNCENDKGGASTIEKDASVEESKVGTSSATEVKDSTCADERKRKVLYSSGESGPVSFTFDAPLHIIRRELRESTSTTNRTITRRAINKRTINALVKSAGKSAVKLAASKALDFVESGASETLDANKHRDDIADKIDKVEAQSANSIQASNKPEKKAKTTNPAVKNTKAQSRLTSSQKKRSPAKKSGPELIVPSTVPDFLPSKLPHPRDNLVKFPIHNIFADRDPHTNAQLNYNMQQMCNKAFLAGREAFHFNFRRDDGTIPCVPSEEELTLGVHLTSQLCSLAQTKDCLASHKRSHLMPSNVFANGEDFFRSNLARLNYLIAYNQQEIAFAAGGLFENIRNLKVRILFQERRLSALERGIEGYKKQRADQRAEQRKRKKQLATRKKQRS